jgi:DNA polymerase/3'-5' exonuclease PolX
VNKRVVEILAERIYALELEAALPAKTWAYRKAAWAVEDLETDIRLVYQSLGLKGLQRLEGVGPAIAKEIERLLIQEAGAMSQPDGHGPAADLLSRKGT